MREVVSKQVFTRASLTVEEINYGHCVYCSACICMCVCDGVSGSHFTLSQTLANLSIE